MYFSCSIHVVLFSSQGNSSLCGPLHGVPFNIYQLDGKLCIMMTVMIMWLVIQYHKDRCHQANSLLTNLYSYSESVHSPYFLYGKDDGDFIMEAITEEKQLICGHLPVGGGGGLTKFRTFLG